MKIFRRILLGAALLLVLAGLLAGLAFVPGVQTWYAQSQLDAREDVHGTVGSLSAGLHRVELADVHLEMGAVVVDVPALQATLPVADAAWKHDVRIQGLVAKGWTIDLSRTLEPAKLASPAGAPEPAVKPSGAGDSAPPAEVSGVQQALTILRRLASGQELPGNVAIDGLELEGDVIVFSPHAGSVRVHVRIVGGGVAPGREADLAVEADAVSPWPGVRDATLRGHLLVATKTARRIDRVALKADTTLSRESAAENLNVDIEAALTRGDAETVYRLGLSQAGRRKVALQVHCPDATPRLHGKWELYVTQADLGLVWPELPWPALASTAGGRFESDAGFAHLQVDGKVSARAGELGTLAPALSRLGEVGLAVNFKLERDAGVLRFAAADATVTRGATLVSVQSRQTFSIDEQTGRLTVAEPKRDWLEGTARRVPLEWLMDPNGGLAVSGGEVTGDFLVQAESGAVALRPAQPWALGGVTVQRSGRALVRNVDLTLAWQASRDADGLHAQWTPLVLSQAGRRLAEIEAKFDRGLGAHRTVTVTGKWNADLDALAKLPGFAQLGLLGRSASGDFTANLAALSQVDAKLTVVGRDPTHGLTASVTAGEENVGRWSFQIPFTLTAGPQVTDLTVEGTWISDPEQGRSYLRVTGEKLAAEQLRDFAAPLARLAGVAWPENLIAGDNLTVGSAARDVAPFWGGLQVTLVFDVGQVDVADRRYRNVGGSLEFGAGEVKLDHVRGQRVATGPDAGLRPRAEPAQLEGRITFAAASALPYTLKLTADIGEIDATTLVPPPGRGDDPLLEGHFTVTGGWVGSGANLADLAARTRQEFTLTSKAGISRLLKVFIGDVFQDEESSALADTVGGVGSLVGKLLALKSEVHEKKVSPATENVLDLSSVLAEIEFESCRLTVVRDSSGAIRITSLEIVAPDTRLTGTGEIAGGQGPTYFGQPLQLNLTLAARGHTAELAGKAGLLTKTKDAAGYANFASTLQYGGTLEHLDQRAWHDLLVKAMDLPPAKSAKGAAVSARP